MSQHNDCMTEAEEFITQQSSARLTVKEIAHAVEIHPSDFVREFRREKGITPRRYLDERLKQRVLQQLNGKSVFGYNICYELGFSNEKIFYRWVKRVFGVRFKELSAQYGDGTKKNSALHKKGQQIANKKNDTQKAHPRLLPRKRTQK